jgi:aminoglycoside phosphotransferase (APT) family kinase protein
VIVLVLPAGRAEPVLVAKLPRLAGDGAALAHEADMLRAIQATRPAGLDSVPTVIAFEKVGDYPLLVETALVGPSLDRAAVRRDPARACALGVDWLVDMATPPRKTLDEAAFARLVTDPLDAFADGFPLARDDMALLAATRGWGERLRGASLPLVLEHGDLSHPNLILHARNGLGVVDWELAQLAGLPAHDLFFFLTYVAFARHDAHTTEAQTAAFRGAFFGRDAWARPYVLEYARRLGLAAQWLGPLFALCWARYTGQLCGRVHAAEGLPARNGDRAAWLRGNRYYALWQYAIQHMGDLAWL